MPLPTRKVFLRAGFLALCLLVLFWGVPLPAACGAKYEALTVPTVPDGYVSDLGDLLATTTAGAVYVGDVVNFRLPENFSFPWNDLIVSNGYIVNAEGYLFTIPPRRNDKDNGLFAFNWRARKIADNEVQLVVDSFKSGLEELAFTNDGYLILHLRNISVPSGRRGDVALVITASPGSGFSSGAETIGEVNGPLSYETGSPGGGPPAGEQPPPPAPGKAAETAGKQIVAEARTAVKAGADTSLELAGGQAGLFLPREALPAGSVVSLKQYADVVCDGLDGQKIAAGFGAAPAGVYAVEVVDADGRPGPAATRPFVLAVRIPAPAASAGPVGGSPAASAAGAATEETTGSGYGLYALDPVYKTLVPLKATFDPSGTEIRYAGKKPRVFFLLREGLFQPADVPAGAWYAGVVSRMARKNLLNVGPEQLCRPEDALTRAEAARLVTLAAGIPGQESEAGPPDARGHWGRPFLATVLADGLLAAGEDGKINPDQALTRAELVTMVLKAREVPVDGGAAAPFTDVQGHPAAGAITRAAELGLLGGYPDGTFRPDRPVTRAEACAVAARAFKW